MTKKFIERVIREYTVDTSKYRYVCNELPDRLEIRRLPLSDLDTTAAISGWEVVYTERAVY